MTVDVYRMKKDLLKTKPTLYCSARAHLRGKLHMCRVNGGTISHLGYYSGNFNPIDERRHLFEWTMNNQEKYVRDTIIEYTYDENEVHEVKQELVLLT